MNSLKSKFVAFRNFYQNQINSNIASVIIKNCKLSSPLFKPFYLDFLNYIPYFILRTILNFYDINYLYETDGIIKNSIKDTNTLLPIVLSFQLINKNNETVIDLKNITKNYSNNISLDYIIKNEYLKFQDIELNYYFLSYQLFTIINNNKNLSSEEKNYKSSLEESMDSNVDLQIIIKIIKQGMPRTFTFDFSTHKHLSKNELNQLF
jgi:hypothetical protein